jgi:hypothetical protein
VRVFIFIFTLADGEVSRWTQRIAPLSPKRRLSFALTAVTQVTSNPAATVSPLP